ncbi:MAG TPA: MFS transporter [Gaiellaceae bacterium]|nr:MFS transporter [Gaiellaceae bacterium]
MERALAALGGLRAALRNDNLRRVELAWGAAIAAEWAHFVALGIYAYDEGGTVGVGIAGVVRMLPAALVAPFAASLGDRYRRERFLLAIAVVGCVALAASAVAFLIGSVPLVFALAAVVGLSATLVRPALQALLPSLARTPEELIAANGATSTLEGFGTLAGPVAAGILVSVLDVGAVFAVGAFAFLASALLLVRVRAEGVIRLREAAYADSTLRLLLGGFRAVLRRRRPRLVVGLILAQTFVRGCLNVLIVVAAFRVLDAGAGAVGYMTAAVGVGGLLGAIGAVALERRRLAASFGVALVFWGLPIVLFAPWPELGAALLLLAIVGAANSVEDVAVFTLLQRIVPDDVLTRVLGVTWGLAMGGVALGSIAAPALVAAVGPRTAFVAVGVILPLLTLLTWRRLVEIDRDVSTPVELALIEAVPMFAPLPLAAKEHMAAALVPVEVRAGEAVIEAGAAGDRFYIVGDGEFEVRAPGVHQHARPGDHFGEIALLRDVPRTATVRAAVDSSAYALERDDFLAAVTGHPGVHAAGEAVVTERLARVPSLDA